MATRSDSIQGNFSAQWYALYVRSRHENNVAAQLEGRRYPVFLPVYQARHRWTDRWKVICQPLFPGYVFCHFDQGARRDVITTSGVVDIVRNGSELAPIHESEIEVIKQTLDSKLPLTPHPSLVMGQRVVMRGGPLKGIRGTLMEFRNGVRLVISVELLQRSVLVEIDNAWAAPCEQSSAAISGGLP